MDSKNVDVHLLMPANPKFVSADYWYEFDEQIQRVCFSPYEYSQEIILVAHTHKISVGLFTAEDEISFKELIAFDHAPHCSGLSISPKSCLNTLPATLLFCTAASDYKIRVYESDLQNENSCKVLEGHKFYINDVSFDPENLYIASVSDDQTAKIWSTTTYECVATLKLSSQGRSVCWHKDDISKLLVAEKAGIIRCYNVDTQKPINSIVYNLPLSSAHWFPSDPLKVAALQTGEMLVFDLTKPGQRPILNGLMFLNSGGQIRVDSTGDFIGITNQLSALLKVIHVPTLTQKVYAHVMTADNLSWHFRHSIVCCGSDRKLMFWNVMSK